MNQKRFTEVSQLGSSELFWLKRVGQNNIFFVKAASRKNKKISIKNRIQFAK